MSSIKSVIVLFILAGCALGQVVLPRLNITTRGADTMFLTPTRLRVDTILVYKRLKAGVWMVDSATGRDSGTVAVRDTIMLHGTIKNGHAWVDIAGTGTYPTWLRFTTDAATVSGFWNVTHDLDDSLFWGMQDEDPRIAAFDAPIGSILKAGEIFYKYGPDPALGWGGITYYRHNMMGAGHDQELGSPSQPVDTSYHNVIVLNGCGIVRIDTTATLSTIITFTNGRKITFTSAKSGP